ncbi:MAG: T9SS type A sorting domain-containing protein [Candidatus Kapaibacterium sp.]
MKYLLLFIAIPTILFSQEWDNEKWENYDFYKDGKLLDQGRFYEDVVCFDEDCYAVTLREGYDVQVFKLNLDLKRWDIVYDGSWDPFNTPEEEWPDIIEQPRGARIIDDSTIFIYYKDEPMFNIFNFVEDKYDTIHYTPKYATRNADIYSDGFGIADPGGYTITTTDFWKTYKYTKLDFPSSAIDKPMKVYYKRYMIGDYFSGQCYFISSYDGENWERTYVGDFYPYSIYFIDEQVGFISGGIGNTGDSKNDVIYKTTDGGNSWYEVLNQFQDPASWGIYDISLVGNEYGIATSTVGLIYTTTDGGENWEYDVLSQVNKTNAKGFTRSSENKFFLLNYSQGILSYDAELLGITSVPFYNYKELTVYPNPFNTTINLSTDGVLDGLYKIKIYNSSSELVFEYTDYVSDGFQLSTDLPAGAYYLLLEGDGYYYKKLIKE